MKAFYSREPGYCLSTTINKYIYVSVIEHNGRNEGLRVMYDTTEDVKCLDELKNELVKNILEHTFAFNLASITISSMSDIKTSGNGLGSSSAFTVGLINAMNGAPNEVLNPWDLAEQACEVEIDKCKQPIGKQDQYAAALGGLNLFCFHTDGQVSTEMCRSAQENLTKNSSHFILMYSGQSHNASNILKAQNEAITNDEEKFKLLKTNAYRARMGYELLQKDYMDDFGELLHEAWLDKKAITNEISNPHLDEIYEHARKLGATGGKILGAGGGGFFIFYVPKADLHRVGNIERDLVMKFPNCRIYDFIPTFEGSKVYMI